MPKRRASAAATTRWEEAWEEEDAIVQEVSPEPVSAKALTLPIVQFGDRAAKGKLNLSPSYQRGDVWPTSDAQLLMESILRGIPLPSVIILKPDGQSIQFEVVDGKQRLTAILRFIGRHPQAIDRVKQADMAHPDVGLLELFTTDYPKFRHAWKNVTGDALSSKLESEYYFPFKLRTGSTALSGPLSALQGKYYTQIRSVPITIADEEVEVSDVFERSGGYEIPVIEYSRATRRQIHEVFNLYNKQGKHLNAEEIRNALYHQLDMMRGLIVASGDNEAMTEVAGFLEPSWGEVGRISGLLDDYGFGKARYRRTKVLSWLASLLFQDAIVQGKPTLQSTARHINTLLDRIEADPAGDLLAKKANVREAVVLMSQGIWAHSSVPDAWAPDFRHNKGHDRWQELQRGQPGRGDARQRRGWEARPWRDSHNAQTISQPPRPRNLGLGQARPRRRRSGSTSDESASPSWTSWEWTSPRWTARSTQRFTYSPVATLVAARDLRTNGG